MSGFGPTGMGTRAGPGFPQQIPRPGAGAFQQGPQSTPNPSTPPPVMTPPQQQRPDYLKDALNGINTFGEQLKGAHRQRLNNAVTNLSNSGRGMSLSAEGQPQSVKRMNPDQLREYHDNIFEHQNQINGYVKEIDISTQPTKSARDKKRLRTKWSKNLSSDTLTLSTQRT